MERIVNSITEDLRMKRMEALVHDLTSALEESSRSVTTRRRWGLRRRTRSTGNLPLSVGKTASDDSSSGGPTVDRDKLQSDSDDVSQRQLAPFSLTARRVAHLHGNLESDSFNENFSPVHPSTRRKRKLKRMAVETSGPEQASTSRSSVLPGLQQIAIIKKKRILRHAPNCENRLNSFLCGKRKRSLRERSLDCSGVDVCLTGRVRTRGGSSSCHKIASEDTHMDCSTTDSAQCEMMSSSSLSSSESDNGIYTNDEGREGDDEQSDWIGESGGGKVWWEEGEGSDTDKEDEPQHSLLFSSLAGTNGQTSSPFSAREIRSGRRRVRSDRPGFSIVTSANEKLSRFLQDPKQLRLRLHPMQRRERDQLCHLAQLYSLELTSELACPILTKTGNTVRVEPTALNRLRLHHGLADCKRRRWAPPHPVLAPPTFNLNAHLAGESSSQNTSANSPTFRGMTWEPGPSRAKYHTHSHGHKSS